ncbi:MAG: exodeoxyribonuclease V subunit alpha [Spirochaetales bacterium]|nr:exodeoxyribonuclease V subunit alpha [Spirochaetales bacterium]
MKFKAYHSRAREDGAEWYQIFLADKLASEGGGEKDLFFFLLNLFKENESGHLRVELEEDGRAIMEKYGDYFRSDNSPFVVSENRYLYTRRRKAQEDEFLERMERLFSREKLPLIEGLEDYLPASSEVRSACLKINREPFYIITGGPGTGKTTALSGIIHALNKAALQSGREPLRIALAAPTGRAAKRMEQSLSERNISEEARTLHKMLKIRFDTGEPGYDRNNPLPADLVVVDEASMIDLRMMSLLFDALPSRGHLLLVGDKDQLPSVEAGALFSDFLYDSEKEGHRLADKVLLLKKVYRSNKEIITLAGAIIKGEKEETRRILEEKGEAVAFHPFPDRAEKLYRTAGDFYGEHLPPRSRGFEEKVTHWESCRDEMERWFVCYNERIILCPSRKGLYGVERVNGEVRERLFKGGLHGIPLMISINDYDLNLFNGDRGVIFLFAGEPHVFFKEADGYRHIPLTYLGEWEESWVQTIHKSQGSEFREVAVMLPEGADKLLSREILYTALTRAKDKVRLYSDISTLEACLDRGVFRNSRIKEVLSAGPSPV